MTPAELKAHAAACSCLADVLERLADLPAPEQNRIGCPTDTLHWYADGKHVLVTMPRSDQHPPLRTHLHAWLGNHSNDEFCSPISESGAADAIVAFARRHIAPVTT